MRRNKQEEPEETALVKPTDQATDVVPYDDLLDSAGEGQDDPGREDYAIPFINLLQALSPQVDPEDGVAGAQAGMFYNGVTDELFPTGLIVVPVYYEKVVNIFIPRDQGGGFVGSFDSREEALENVKEGQDIIDTANHYLLYRTPGGTWAQAVLSCTSTKLKVSRQWNTRLSQVRETHPKYPDQKFTPPIFGTMWEITSVSQENNKGKFYNISLDYLGLVPQRDVFDAAKLFREALLTGRGRGIDYQRTRDTEEVVDDGTGDY
jgi:hypothetical protein